MESGSEADRNKVADELLRSGRLVFLQVAGYTEAQITGFGDLLKLTDEKVNELLHHQAENAIANALGEKIQKHKPRIKRLGGKKHRKRSPHRIQRLA
jgi:hypothetical protein